MVVFGGGESPLAETWSLTLDGLPAWHALPTGPPATKAAAAALDTYRHRMLVFGGYAGAAYSAEIWAFSLDGAGAWTKILPAGVGPSGRMLSGAIYDPVRDRLIITAGLGSDVYNDTWAVNLTGTPAWTQLATSGAAPPAAYGAVTYYSPGTDELVRLGGNSVDASSMFRLPLGAANAVWSTTTTTGAAPSQFYAAAAYVPPPVDGLLWFGGVPVQPLPPAYLLSPSGAQMLWTTMGGTGPAGRFLHTCVYDAPHARLLVFGGSTGGQSYVSDIWSLTLDLPVVPDVRALVPSQGAIGDVVHVQGGNFDGASAVDFAGVPAPINSSTSTEIVTTVPSGAVTGRVHVTGPGGKSASPYDFVVLIGPRITSVQPGSGEWGDTISVFGDHFSGLRSVSLGGVTQPDDSLVSDTLLRFVISQDAVTGPIRVTTVVSSTLSADTVVVRPTYAEGRITSIRDVPNDQGGRVVIKWWGGGLDRVQHSVVKYRVWRRAPMSAAAALRRAPPASPGPDYWEPLAEIPAIHLTGYAYTAPTTQDSLEGSNPYTPYFVETVLTSGASLLSPPDSGYSVDNLAPPSPSSFAARYSGSLVALHWLPSLASDFREFRLYRGPTATFVPGPTTLVIATRDTGYVDHPPGGAGDFYKLGVADVHGNVSRYSLVTPAGATGTLASLVSATWTGTTAQLTWFGSALPGATVTVYRSEDGAPWVAVATRDADGLGYVHYDDASLVRGVTYRYQLGFLDGDGERFAGLATIQLPIGRLAIRAVAPNPNRGEALRLLVDLSSSSPARVRILDLSGRLVQERMVDGSLTGEVAIPLQGRAPLRPGVYIVELRQDGQRAVSRFTLIR